MTDAKTITLALKGRWLGSYGIAFCPAHENTQTPALSLSNGSNGRLLASCHAGCDFRSIAKALRSEGLVGRNCDSPRSDPGEHARRSGVNKPAQTAKLRARARNLWDQGQPITGTHGEMYLRGRAITGPLPASLRWLPDIYHQPSGQFSSAMIADVQPTGGVHRTFFTKKGARVDKSPKMMLGPCSGGAVRLSEAVGPLVVCEGIETGLSLLSGLLRGPATVLATLSTSGMKALELPPKPHRLTIATDGDDPGKLAGDVLKARATALGWSVRLLPAPDGRDWNDVLVGKRGGREAGDGDPKPSGIGD